MSAKDISRFLFQPQKRYSSVRMQQGRVILDSDWNESERIDDEEARRTLAETVCANGTPNEGFLVRDVTEATVTVPPAPSKETYDFTLGSGSFYLGGLRFEVVPQIVAEGPDLERFLSQTDWLQIDADLGNLPARPSVADLTNADGSFKVRHDLVYLRGWEQGVTAVEDSELRERALGGPDTSVRMRRMRRIEVLPNVDLDLTSGNFCAEAFARLRAQLTAPRQGDDTGEPHLFDDANCELRSKAKLTITFGGEGITEDPCKPAVTAGFLGAENQTIRVQLTATNRFIWGYDNASPFYRVQVLEEAGRPVKIKFLTLPRDQAAQPLKGQAVEILPWSAFLSNQEKVAEPQGHLATVATSFNPEEQTITLSKPVPKAWIDWLNAPAHEKYLSERDPADKKKYFYLRLWTGGSGDAEKPDHAFTPGTRAELLGIGLDVAFSQHGLPGDFWIIAARPNTPDLVVPWELVEQAPPAGTRFFFTPLALILWFVPVEFPTTVKSQVLDCRHRFRSLCEVAHFSTGRVIFEKVTPGASDAFPLLSPLIPHGLDVNNVAIILALEADPGRNPSVVMGDLDAFNFIADIPPFDRRPFPVLMATTIDPNRRFTITLKDLRDQGGPQTWVVRWWAIPKALDQPDVIVPRPGAKAAIVVTPTSLDFGNVTTEVTATLTVKNIGTAALHVNSIDSSDNTHFSAVSPLMPFTIPVGGADVPVTVRFKPTFDGAETIGVLSINSNDPDSPSTVPVRGIGSASAPEILVTKDSLDFGTVSIENPPEPRNFDVRNRGHALLEVDPITIDSESFTLVSPTEHFTVDADGSKRVTVRFTPTDVGDLTATLTINSNDPSGPRTVSLLGEFLQPEPL